LLFGQKNIARYISAQQQNYILRNDAMYIRLIRNKAKGNAISGRLVIDGRWFCYTLERKGVEIPALCYHVAVTQSPKFKRLLPLVCGVPRTMSNVESQKSKVNETSAAVSPDFKHSTLDIKQSALRSGIRFHRGTKPQHSTGCILVVADNYPMPLHSTPYTIHPPQGRTSANVEQELTSLILKAQQDHEEIILEVTDFTPGTEYGYNTPCEPELQKR
jgi:hypothetical protein